MGTLITVKNSKGKIIGRCDSRCYNAKHEKCDCCCGGKNHGVGLQKAVQNTEEMIIEGVPDIDKKNRFSFPIDVRKQPPLFSL